MHASPNATRFCFSDDPAEAPGGLKPIISSCGRVLLNQEQGRALVGDVDIGLSAAEFATVRLLFARRGVPMSRESILAAMTDPAVDPRLIDVYVSRARVKFASAGLGDAIKTVWGRGYMAGEPDEDETDPAEPRSRDLGMLLALT